MKTSDSVILHSFNMGNDFMNNPQERSLFSDRNLYIIFSITLLAIMGVSSITPAFPKIIRQFGINEQQIGMLITVFTLPGVFLAPVMGILADRYGRKTILLPSILLFGLGGFLCTLAGSYQWLLFYRFIQGLGAVSLGMINITMIGDLYSGNRRATAMGYNASVLSLGTASYPAIGGALATLAWYFPFYLPLLAIPVGLVVIFKLKNPEPEKSTDIIQYLKRTWRSINVRDVWGLFLITVLLFIILYGSYLTFFPLLLEKQFEAGSLVIGLTMSGMSVTTALVSSQLGKLRKIFKARTLLLVSSLLYLIAMMIMTYAATWGIIIVAIIFFGMGHGMVIPNVLTMVVGYASIKERAAFMSINSMVLRVGQTLGPVVIGILYNLGGLNAAFLGGAGTALAMIIIIFTMIRYDQEKHDPGLQ